MIVPDASVVVPALVDAGGSGALAREVFAADGDLHAPHLLDIEVASVLRRHAMAGILAPARVEAALVDLDDLAVTRYPHLGLLPRVWQLRANLSAYDAAYVALAESLGATLVTADGRLGRAPGLCCHRRVLA
ncbi:MAG: type II toxin-antitoxin system VapC family toxin [Pseudonocardiaceae bacterium]